MTCQHIQYEFLSKLRDSHNCIRICIYAVNWTLFLFGMPPRCMSKIAKRVKINKDFYICIEYAILCNADHEYVSTEVIGET